MRRTFNYTNRVKINRDRVNINLETDNDVTKYLNATIELEETDFPKDASVYLEAYHKTDLERYNMGEVCRLSPIQKEDISHLVYIKNIKFRVLVIDESKEHGKILASADRISASIDNKEVKNRRSILPIDFVDLGQEVWKLDFTGEQPYLVVNKRIPNIGYHVQKNPRFFFYVYPSVIRELFTYMLFNEGVTDYENPTAWQKDWLVFAKTVLKDDEIPEFIPDNLKDSRESEEAVKWIDRIVSEFCKSKKAIWPNFINMEEGGDND